MTSREARKLRRAAERKSKKFLLKQNRSSSTAARLDESAARIPGLDFDGEFSPEFIAEANAARKRVEARMAAYRSLRSPQSQSIAPGSDEAASLSEPKPPDRARINRANAQHSTGPRSPEGKLASSRNSLKHGLASGQLIIAGEDPAELEALLQNLLDEHQPANTTEEILIHEMAQSFWLAQRAIRLQNDCFSEAGPDDKRTGPFNPLVPVVRVQEQRLALFLRYQTTHERAFHKALNTLIRLQKDRHRLAIGFVSQKRAAQVRTASTARIARRRVPRIQRLVPAAPVTIAEDRTPPLASNGYGDRNHETMLA